MGALARIEADSERLFRNLKAKVNGNKRKFTFKAGILKCLGGYHNSQKEKITLSNVKALEKNSDTKFTITVKSGKKYKITGSFAKDVAHFLLRVLETTQIDQASFVTVGAPIKSVKSGGNVKFVDRRRRLLEYSQ